MRVGIHEHRVDRTGYKESIRMGDNLGHRDFCLWDSGHNSSSDVLFWNRADHWLPRLGRSDRALVFCIRDAQRWWFSLANIAEHALWDGGSIPLGEPAFECSFVDPDPGDFSFPGGHFGTRALLLSQTIPPFRLGAD